VAAFGRVDGLRRRHDSEYPDVGSPDITEADAADALDLAEDVIGGARQLPVTGRIDEFR